MNERRPPVLERPVMREQFRKELRGRLMSEAAVVLAPRPSWFSFPAILRPAFAAAAILVLVLGINLVGDWLRDVLDPRLERGL